MARRRSRPREEYEYEDTYEDQLEEDCPVDEGEESGGLWETQTIKDMKEFMKRVKDGQTYPQPQPQPPSKPSIPDKPPTTGSTNMGLIGEGGKVASSLIEKSIIGFFAAVLLAALLWVGDNILGDFKTGVMGSLDVLSTNQKTAMKLQTEGDAELKQAMQANTHQIVEMRRQLERLSQ